MRFDYTRDELLRLSKEELIDDILLPLLQFIREHIQIVPKTSKNSSKPPSTDMKSSVKEEEKVPNKGGAKKGHQAHHKKNVENPDRKIILEIEECPNCGSTEHNFNGNTFETHQILELKSLQFEVIELLKRKSTCSVGNISVTAPSPPGIYNHDYFGPRLKALILILYYQNFLSYNKIRQFIFTFGNIKVSKSAIINVVKRCGKVFHRDYEQIKEHLRNDDIVMIDETGWRVDNSNYWMWVFNNDETVFYTIDKSRGRNVVLEILGPDFDGGLISDFFNVYSNNIPSKWKQKCLAHLIRFLKFVFESTGNDTKSFAGRLLQLFRDSIHLKNSVSFGSKPYKRQREKLENMLNAILSENVTHKLEIQLKKRLIKYRNELFIFLYNKCVPATNNASESALRSRVIHRKICNGNRSITGKDTYAIIITIIENLKKQGLDLFENLIKKLSSELTFQPKLLDNALLNNTS